MEEMGGSQPLLDFVLHLQFTGAKSVQVLEQRSKSLKKDCRERRHNGGNA